MSAAQVPEWVRIFEAIIIGLGLGTFLWGGGAAIGYVICLTVKGVKALFRRKAKETEKFVAEKFREFNENIKESNKILEPLTRLGEILKESKK